MTSQVRPNTVHLRYFLDLDLDLDLNLVLYLRAQKDKIKIEIEIEIRHHLTECHCLKPFANELDKAGP